MDLIGFGQMIVVYCSVLPPLSCDSLAITASADVRLQTIPKLQRCFYYELIFTWSHHA